MAHFLRLNFPFLPFYFYKGAVAAVVVACVRGIQWREEGVGGSRGWRVVQTTSTCLVYFAVSVALHSHSSLDPNPFLAGQKAPPAARTSAWPMLAGVIFILHLAFSCWLCYCCCSSSSLLLGVQKSRQPASFSLSLLLH